MMTWMLIKILHKHKIIYNTKSNFKSIYKVKYFIELSDSRQAEVYFPWINWHKQHPKFSRHKYSGTPLLRTPLGQLEVSLLKEVSSFQGSFCTHLYVGGTNHSVLFKVDVLISGVSL